jgi:Short-chain dehydrogenases of various substrate specificities
VRGFSEAVMKEVREDGIRVTCLYPGSVETNFFDVAGVDMTENPLDPTTSPQRSSTCWRPRRITSSRRS